MENNNQPTSQQKEDIFWLEQKETNSGKMLSCKLNSKHYVGWWFNKEQKREDGTTYNTEIAKMRLCNWDGCNTCHPEIII
jgi:hypothetical protein